MSTLCYPAPVVKSSPAEVAPADVEPTGPTPADAQWWTEHCDHSDWAREGELSPDEQDAELEHLDRYNAALEAMFEASYQADMIERGIPCW